MPLANNGVYVGLSRSGIVQMSCADHDDNFSFMLVLTTSIAGSDLTAPDGLLFHAFYLLNMQKGSLVPSLALVYNRTPNSFAFFHIRTRLSFPSQKSSTHSRWNGGSLRPGFPSPGSPATRLKSSKYSSYSGWMRVNAPPSPCREIRSASQRCCSSSGGSCAFPASTRAAATACHSKTLKVNPVACFCSVLLSSEVERRT